MSAIVVTGMHRSGTSLLAEILVHDGVRFGAAENWLPADESNPHGYFEDRRVVSLDDRLLHLWKGTWDEPPEMPGRWLDDRRLQPLAGEAAAWIATMATADPWGWKDPRASLVLPFWRRLCPGLRCILCIRDPLEVGRSLRKRDQIPPDKAAFLWLHYLAQALEGVGEAPCAVFFYEDLLNDPSGQVKRLLQFAGAQAHGSVRASTALVDPQLRRQRAEQAVQADEEPLEHCRSVYARVRALFGDAGRPVAGAGDEAARAARVALGLVAPSPEARRRKLHVKFTELALAQATADDLRRAHDRATWLLAEKEDEIASARNAIVERDTALGALERRLAGEAEAARNAIAARDRELERAAQAQLALDAAKNAEIDRAREAIVARDRKLDTAAQAFEALDAAKNAEIDRAREAIVARDQALEKAAQALQALDAAKNAEIDRAREAIVARDRELEKATQALCALDAAKSAEIARAREALVALEERLAQEAEAARGAVAKRDRELDTSAQERAALTEALARARERTRDLEMLAASRADAVAALTAQAHELQEQQARAAARIDELRRDAARVAGALDAAEHTIGELATDRSAWTERRRALLARVASRMKGTRGFWRGLVATRGLTRSEAEQAGELLMESATSAHFDEPDFGRAEEGDIRFAGWCLHPARELTGLALCLNGAAHTTRFGLDRPDVGAAFPHAPGSSHSGFLVSVPLRPGRYLVTLEAQCRDFGTDVYVAPRPLVVRGRPFWKRAGAGIERAAGLLGYAALKLRRRLAAGRGLPSWREIPAQLHRARHEFQRRRGGSTALQPPAGFALPAPIDPYDAWLADNPWGPRQEAELRARLSEARNLPRISVVTPVYRPDLAHFLETAASVRAQLYDNWEWCIADDASDDAKLTAALADLAANDSRIRCTTRSENGHISLATNSAAELARGEFIALLDHDDLLAPDCLAEVALHLAAHGDVDVLYTDDDKVDVDGRRYGPQFKPDWSPESLLSQMYFSHLFVVRRSLYEQAGGMRAGFEGSQDHDLALRVTEKARRVAHLPLVLYHWRAAPGSTALSGEAKTYSFDAGMRAVAEALERRGVPARTDRPEWAVQAKASLVRHVFPDDGPRVAILIATRNRVDLLERCVDSLARTRYRNFEVVVLDDHSDDPETLEWLARFPGRVLRSPGPREGFNFAAIHNRAAREVDADYLLLLNNDTEVLSPDWLSQMAGFARLPGVGAVGARLLFPDRTVQHAGILHGFNQGSLALAFRGLRDDDPGYLAAARVCRNYAAVTAACLLTPRRLFLELGGFDEERFPVSFNDVDYCYRLVDSGYRCVYAAEAELVHHEGASRGIGSRVDEVARFRSRYRDRREPYYSPNLSTTSERFEIRPRHLARRPERPVKALMVAHTLDLTGAPFCQWEMTVALSERGRLDPVVVSPEDGPMRELYEEHGIPVRIVPHGVDTAGSTADYERELAAFTRHMLDADVEVVYGNTLKTFFAIDAARRLGLPSLWNVRESEPWQTYYDGLPDDVARRALECFAFPYRVLFVSNASRAVYEPLNSRHNFQVIHDGLDLRQWEVRTGGRSREAARSALGIGADEVAIVLLGTVCERKGQHDLPKALALVAPDVATRLRCFVVGDRPGEYSRALAGLVHKLPAALRRRVHVVAETRDVAEYYRAADVFVCTSRIESYPRVTLEAMACGLPIVSTPVFGLAEQLVDDVNAILYPPGDAAALAAAIARLAGDASLRERMGSASRVVLAGLKSFDEMVDDYGVQFAEAREIR